MADGTPFMLGPQYDPVVSMCGSGEQVRCRNGEWLLVDLVLLPCSGHTSLPGASELAISGPKNQRFCRLYLACYCSHCAIVMMWRGISLGMSGAPHGQRPAVIGCNVHISGAGSGF